MWVTVRFGEPFWRVVGQRLLKLELDSPASVGSLIDRLQRDFPALEREFSEAPPQLFVDDHPASEDTPLTDGARLHLVWAVSGG